MGLAVDWRMGFSIDSFSANESTSIHSIAGNWNRPIHSGDQAVSVSRMRWFIEREALRLGYMKRLDIHYAYSNDTVTLLYLAENKLPLPAGSNYELLIEAKRSSSEGLQFGYTWQVDPGLSFYGDINLLTPDSLQLGYLTGQANTVSESDYDFSFTSDLAYDEDPLYSRQAQSIDGDGYSVDLGVDYQPDKSWRFQLNLLDVVGRLNIPHAPHTLATASSETKRFDDQGYVIYDPVIRGREDFIDRHLDFDLQVHADIRYRIDERNSLSVQHHSVGDFEYRQVEWVNGMGAAQLRLIVLPEFDALGIGGGNKTFSASLIADSLDYKNVQLLSLQLSLHIPFY